jgi:hypothetical protein
MNISNLRGKPLSIERKITGQIRPVHYNKIDITILNERFSLCLDPLLKNDFMDFYI